MNIMNILRSLFLAMGILASFYVQASVVLLSFSITDDPDPVLAGGQLNYTLEYSNDSPPLQPAPFTTKAPATSAIITATYDPRVNFANATPPPDVGTDNVWSLGTLSDGASGSIMVTVNVNPLVPSGSILNISGVLASTEASVNATEATAVQSLLPPGQATPIPALSPWALIILIVLSAAIASLTGFRRRG